MISYYMTALIERAKAKRAAQETRLTAGDCIAIRGVVHSLGFFTPGGSLETAMAKLKTIEQGGGQ